jgi:glycosyltransferase involved in cell wall biosynthesis
MYKNKKISVILPTYNEKDSIRKVVNDFNQLGIIDEIIVINNNAAAGTSEEVAKTKAREVFEPIQGYGAAIKRGFKESTGELVVVCEPDDTFLAADILKFLAYCEDVDIVYGTRTVSHFIWEGANMGVFLKWGNWATAKLMEVIFNTNYLSDVGCTYRLISRKALNSILPVLCVNSNFFGPEMMIRGFQLHLKAIQIPVNYKDRIGTSSVTGDLKKAFFLGLKMIILIIGLRFNLGAKFIRLLERI